MAVQPWKRIEPTVVIKNDYRHVVIKTFRVPESGNTKTIATWGSEGGRSAAVIALTKDNRVIISRQYRPGPERIMDEIPGGRVDDNEDPEVGAKRELQEETGYVPGEFELLGMSSRDAYINSDTYYYLATNCELAASGQHLDEDEEVEVVLMTIDEFIKNAKDDNMSDPAAVLLAYDRLQELQAAA